MTTETAVRLYDDNAEDLIDGGAFADRVTLLPGRTGRIEPGSRLRVMWGQDMLRDLLDGRYRTVICGVNDEDNAHGIIAQLVSLITTSQWSVPSVTSYAKMFQQSVAVHAADDREPYVLKFDLDRLLVLALLRPGSRDHFTLSDLARGFETITKMTRGRPDRTPIATVSFQGAASNRLVDDTGSEPSFESILRTMYDAGYRGDVFPSPKAWTTAHCGVFPGYPFPDGLERMRQGSS